MQLSQLSALPVLGLGIIGIPHISDTTFTHVMVVSQPGVYFIFVFAKFVPRAANGQGMEPEHFVLKPTFKRVPSMPYFYQHHTDAS